jgi:hypothetical protein
MAADEVAPIQAVERKGPGASAADRERPCGGLPVGCRWCGARQKSDQRTLNIRQQKWGSGARLGNQPSWLAENQSQKDSSPIT